MSPAGDAARARKHNVKARKAAKKRFRNYLDRIAKIAASEKALQRKQVP